MRHCPTCKCVQKSRKRIPRVTRKVSTRAVDGVVKLGNGQELDKGRAARDRRRDRIHARDEGLCQQRIRDDNWQPVVGEFGAGDYLICGTYLALSDAHIHHIRKRSLRGGDQDTNQVTLCHDHHRLYHPGPQWSKKMAGFSSRAKG